MDVITRHSPSSSLSVVTTWIFFLGMPLAAVCSFLPDECCEMMTPRSYHLATTITHLAVTNLEVNECPFRETESRDRAIDCDAS